MDEKAKVTEEVIEEKVSFGTKVKGFFKKHKTKFLIGGALIAGAAVGAAGMYANTISEQDYLALTGPDPDDEDDSSDDTEADIAADVEITEF